MSIPLAAITENYQALKILKKSQLSAAIGDPVEGSVEYYLNTYVRNNFLQLAADVLGDTYNFTNDAVASLVTPLVDLAALLAEDEIITGNWAFNGTVGFSAPVTSSSSFTSSAQPRAKVYRSTSNQSIANNTPTVINFQAETYDTASLHDTSLNTSRITIPTGGAGLYLFTCVVEFDNSNFGIREVKILKNGSAIALARESAPDGTDNAVISLTTQDQANQNDYYEIQVYQNTGGALDVIIGANTTNFAAMKVW